MPLASGCVVREAKERGGPDIYAIATGFAAQGADRWVLSAVINREPTAEEISSYCEAAKLIADSYGSKMVRP